MWTLLMSNTLLGRLMAGVAALVVAFVCGYAYKAHKVKVAEASQTTAQTTTTAAVNATDNQTIKTLQQQLKTQAAYQARLLVLIEDAKRANPATSSDCRIPDGVRDALNADLATAAR